jgi:Ca2+-binding RTX toxin-like protein
MEADMAALANARRGLWADTLAAPTDGPDSIVGTEAADTINGLAGDDTIHGQGGADVLGGGKGGDILRGGEGNDTISGEKGVDTLFGEAGKDRLIGGGGNDSLFGMAGNDDFVFDPGWGVDRAGEGHLGGTDKLVFRGIDVSDVRFSVLGNEILIDMGPNRIVVASQYFYGTGDDALIETAQFGDVVVDLRTPQDSWLVRNGGAGADTLEGSIFGDTILGRAGDDSLHGNLGDDSIRGGLDGDTLHGSDGADTLKGDEGSDFLTGGDGDDGLQGGSEDDTVFAGAGADAIDGGAGDDAVLAGTENDTVVGNLGADSLFGQEGDDRLTGGAGADRFDFTTGGGKDRVVDFEDGMDLLAFFGFGSSYDTEAEILATAVQDGTSVMFTVPNNGTAGTTKVIVENFDLADMSGADLIVS